MKTQITFEEFMAIETKLDIRIGRIDTAERIPKSFGLKLGVNFGDDVIKTAFTNLGKTYEPEQLVGTKAAFIVNLVPSTIKGITSEVMIVVGKTLAGQDEFEDYSRGTKLF